MNHLPPYRISPLGDTALIIDFGNVINEEINELVLSLFYHIESNPVSGMVEAVPAYSSLTIYYDVIFIRRHLSLQTTAFEWMCAAIQEFLSQLTDYAVIEKTLVTVPVCYEKEFGTDLDWISAQNKISIEEIIHLHTSATYRVYMLGFLPGFAYMGMVDEKISSPRKQQPVPVEAGSVGIAGKQTGIYPLRSPGGWQIIGRTPVKLFTKDNQEPTLFKAGDNVQFYSISKDEFEDIKSRNA